MTEAVNFVADMERMGLVRRLRIGRFSSVESAELLKRVLGGPVDAASASSMHVQSEGVPFIVEELARTHREAGTLQQVDGVWRLGRNAARLMPSAVRTLIDRRAARLPARTREVLGEAAILGRSFSLRDLRAIDARLGDGERASQALPAGAASVDNVAVPGTDPLADDLAPAVVAGFLLAQAPNEPADYTFAHEQVRQFAMSQTSATRRRRQVHAAIVDLLLESGDPAPAAPADAGAARPRRRRHGARRHASRSRPRRRPSIPTPPKRRFDSSSRHCPWCRHRRSPRPPRDPRRCVRGPPAFRRPPGGPHRARVRSPRRCAIPAFELDVQLRRASALRMSHDEDAAAELARRVRARALERGDSATELRANIELGQALLRSPLGESFGGVATEVDLDGAEEAYRRAVVLAEERHDDRMLAAALREIGMIDYARGRAWYRRRGPGRPSQRVPGSGRRGADIAMLLAGSPIGPLLADATSVLERALAIFERLGDRTGVMSTVIAMAYAKYAPVIHLARSARHLEEIRRVTSRLSEVVTESERARLDLQMLFGVHVYARAKVVPDLALSRGEEAHRAAKLQGDRADRVRRRRRRRA